MRFIPTAAHDHGRGIMIGEPSILLADCHWLGRRSATLMPV